MSAPDAGPSTVTADAAAPRRGWVKTAWASVALAIACALGELAAGPAYRFGWWSLGAGLQTMRWAATGAAILFVLALLATATAHRRRMRRTLAIFLVAAILGLAAAAPPAYLWFQAQRLPHIHDVSTDTENPPHYVAVLPLRKGARNSTEYDAGVARQQRQGYPDIAPALLAVPAPQAFRHAERAARSMGWEIVAAVPGELRIEATATTLLFGFKDDIVIRVTPSGSGSRVDLRSLSRVGGSDFGANANRIRAFIKKLESAAAD